MFVKVTTSDGRPAWLKAEDVSQVYEDWVQLKHNTHAYKLPPGHGEALVRLLCACGGEQPSEPVDLAEFVGAEKAAAAPGDAGKAVYAVMPPSAETLKTWEEFAARFRGLALRDNILGVKAQTPDAALCERDAVGVQAVEVPASVGVYGKVEVGLDPHEGEDKAVAEPVNPTCNDPAHCHKAPRTDPSPENPHEESWRDRPPQL